jgi:hypothetical protein
VTTVDSIDVAARVLPRPGGTAGLSPTLAGTASSLSAICRRHEVWLGVDIVAALTGLVQAVATGLLEQIVETRALGCMRGG